MIVRILSLMLCVNLLALGIAVFIAVHRGSLIKGLDAEVKRLEASVAEYKRLTETYAEADKQAKEFEKELVNDTNTNNLDVVPADYILKQLRQD